MAEAIQPITLIANFTQAALVTMQAASLEPNPEDAIRWLHAFLDLHGMTPDPAKPEEYYAVHYREDCLPRIIATRYPTISQQTAEAVADAIKAGIQPSAVAAVAVQGWVRQHKTPAAARASIGAANYEQAMSVMQRNPEVLDDAVREMHGNAHAAEWANKTLLAALANAPPEVQAIWQDSAESALRRNGWQEQDQPQPADAGFFA